MADLIAVRAELDNDPHARGYLTMTDQEAADSMNLADIGTVKDLTADAFMEIAGADWPSSAANRHYLIALVGSKPGRVPTTRVGVRTKLGTVFSAATMVLKAAAWGDVKSPAQLSDPPLIRVREGTIRQARDL